MKPPAAGAPPRCSPPPASAPIEAPPRRAGARDNAAVAVGHGQPAHRRRVHQQVHARAHGVPVQPHLARRPAAPRRSRARARRRGTSRAPCTRRRMRCAAGCLGRGRAFAHVAASERVGAMWRNARRPRCMPPARAARKGRAPCLSKPCVCATLRLLECSRQAVRSPARRPPGPAARQGQPQEHLHGLRGGVARVPLLRQGDHRAGLRGHDGRPGGRPGRLRRRAARCAGAAHGAGPRRSHLHAYLPLPRWGAMGRTRTAESLSDGLRWGRAWRCTPRQHEAVRSTVFHVSKWRP
jgi:hypothetical protein